MPKDENAVSYIEEFNRSHRRIKREEKDWYVMYLPRGLGMEDITEKEDRELMAIFTNAEEEMEYEFDQMIKDRFQGYFESLSMVDVIEYLPQKPAPILLENLRREDRNAIKEIYDEGISSGYIQKTIRKQIRKYLEEHGIIKTGEASPRKEPEKEKKRSEKKKDKKPKVDASEIHSYLPQKPQEVQFERLEEEERDHIMDLYQHGIEADYVKKTIRKQIRKYLDDIGYFNRAEKDVGEKDEDSSDGKKTEKKPKKKPTKKADKKPTKKEEQKPKKKSEQKPEKKSDQKVEQAEKKPAKKVVKKAKEPKPEAKKAEKKGGKKGSAGKKKSEPTAKVEVPIDDYLPQKPNPIQATDLKKKDRNHVENLVIEGQDAKLIQKTIRKTVREFLDASGYLNVSDPKSKAKGEKPKGGKEKSKEVKGGKGKIKETKGGKEKPKEVKGGKEKTKQEKAGKSKSKKSTSTSKSSSKGGKKSDKSKK